MSQQDKPRKYLEYPAVIDWLQWSEEFKEELGKPYMPQVTLTLIAEMKSELKNSVPLEVVQKWFLYTKILCECMDCIGDEQRFVGADFSMGDIRKALEQFEQYLKERG